MLLFVWLILPLILLPLFIREQNKTKRHAVFINELYCTGHISDDEYFKALGYAPAFVLRQQRENFLRSQGVAPAASAPSPAPGAPVPPVPPQGVPPIPQGVPPIPQGVPPMPGSIPKPAPAQFTSAGTGNINAPHQNLQNGYIPSAPAYTPPPKQQVSSSSVMLTVGVVLVSVAGLIFATAVWSTMSGLGRSATIAFAAAFFYIISFFSNKKLGVKNSSNAFFMLGSVFCVITFLTAGYYQLMGNEFTFDGDHQWLFIGTSALLAALLAHAGSRLFARPYYHGASICGVYLFYVLLSVDVSVPSSGAFSLMMSAALCVTAPLTAIHKKSGSVTDTLLPVLTGLSAVMTLYSPFTVRFARWKTPDTLAAMVVFLLLCALACKRESRNLWGVHSIYVIPFVISIIMQTMSDKDDLLLMTFIYLSVLCVGLVYRAFPLIRSDISDNVYLIAGAVILIVNIGTNADYSLVPALLYIVLFGHLCIFAFDKRVKPDRNIYPLCLPIPLLFAAVCVRLYVNHSLPTASDTLSRSDKSSLIIASLVVIYAAAEFYFSSLYKSKSFYRLHAYAFTAGAVIMSVFLFDTGENIPVMIFASFAAALAAAATHLSTAQPASAVPAAVCMLVVTNIIVSAVDDGYAFTDLFVRAGVTAFAALLSRLLFPGSLVKTENGKTKADFLAAASMIGLVSLFMLDVFEVPAGDAKTARFVFWLLAAFIAFMFIRKSANDSFNTALRLISSFALMKAFIARPFLVSDEQSVNTKIAVTLVALFGFAARYILRKNEVFSENFAMTVHIISLVILVGDALTHQTLANTLIVMSTAAVIMVVSFIIKKKRWFLISAVMLTGLTIYVCRDFLMSISWWVYLLVVGSALIAIAVTNEYLKNRPRDDSEKPHGRFFEEWKW